MNNKMKVEFLSKSVNEGFARAVVSCFVAQLDPTIEEISDIKTSISEAVTNSIIHAYPNVEGIITIKGKIIGNEVEFEVSDTGVGIGNIEKAKQPLYTTKGDMERSGMGFSIMENFMDELNVESILGLGTKVTMRKKIKKFAFSESFDK